MDGTSSEGALPPEQAVTPPTEASDAFLKDSSDDLHGTKVATSVSIGLGLSILSAGLVFGLHPQDIASATIVGMAIGFNTTMAIKMLTI